jgi:transglutaminase-like putative cysteine protease
VTHRLTVTAAIASAAASTGLFPLFAGAAWFGAGLGAIILIAVIGTATRLRAVRALPAAVCLLASLAGLLVYLNLLYSAKSSFGHVLPTDASLAQLWRLAVRGMADTQRYAAPVPPLRGIVLLATAGIGLVAALTDLIAVRLRRSALAGLPLLVLFSIPVATGAGTDARSDAVVFCLGMAGYLALLSADGQERLRLWGRLVTPWNPGRDEPGETPGSGGPSTRALAASGRRIGLAAVALALFVPLAIPSLHAHKLFPSSHHGPGLGSGPGNGQGLNPLVLMNRQLQESKPTVVFTYHTTDPSPQYLQMFVLGNLTSSDWRMLAPSRGVRPAGSTGALPRVPGLTAGGWRLVRTTIRIRPGALPGETFMPAPYAPRRLHSPGDWLADPGTLMLYGDAQSVSGLDYTVDSLDVTPVGEQLNRAAAGAGPMGEYLAVPPAYQSLGSYARRVVKGAATPAAKAIDLQSWFTTDGGFKYSLNPTVASGAAGVKQFLTTNRTGYCQQFAFAMAVLARLLGIPSRVVVGYTAGTSEGNGNYAVKTSDAHAWPELYFRGLGWLRMEPTPSGAAIGQGTAQQPAYTQTGSSTGTGSGTSTNSGGGTHTSGKNPYPGSVVGRKGGLSDTGAAGIAPGPRPGGGGLGAVLIALAALLAAALVTPRATRSLIRRRRWLTAHDDSARAHAAWWELLDNLTDHGVPLRPGETPRAVAAKVAAQVRLTEPDREALARIAQAEERASYAREPGPSGTLRGDVTAVRGAISASVTRPARWRARLLPSSAVERTRQSLSHALDAFGWLEVAVTRVRRRVPRARTADDG